MADQLSVNYPRHASYGPSPEAFRRRIRQNSPPDPTSWPENPAPRGPRRWCRSRSSAGWRGPGRPRPSAAARQRRRPRCRNHAAGLWGRLGTLDAGVGHGPGDLPVGGRPRPGPEGLAGGLRRRRAKRVDELEGAEQLGRDGDLAPGLGAALQGPDPDRGGFDVDVHGPDGRGARRAASRKRWRSSAVRYFRPRVSTSWRSRIRRDISLNVVSTVTVPQGPPERPGTADPPRSRPAEGPRRAAKDTICILSHGVLRKNGALGRFAERRV